VKKIPKEVLDVLIEMSIEILRTLKTMNNKKTVTKIKPKQKKSNVKNSIIKNRK